MRTRTLLVAVGVLATACGCGPRPASNDAAAGRGAVGGDSGAAETAPGALRPLAHFDPSQVPPVPPEGRVSMVRVAPRRADLALAPPLPEPSEPEPHAAPPASGALAADDELRAPIVREGARVDRARAKRGWVELDVRVDEEGAVSDAMFADGAADSVAVDAAIEATLAMRFWPASQNGRPVAVWCRQRFEFGR